MPWQNSWGCELNRRQHQCDRTGNSEGAHGPLSVCVYPGGAGHAGAGVPPRRSRHNACGCIAAAARGHGNPDPVLQVPEKKPLQ